MKFFFITYIILFFPIILFAQQPNFTGVCYDDVKILSKKVKILNAVPIVYEKQKAKYIYNQNLPINMKSAGYWISKTTNPDEIILNKKQIKEFNKRIKIQQVGLRNIEDYKDLVNVEYLNKNLNARFSWLNNTNYIDVFFNDLPKEFFTNIQNTINIEYTEPFINTKFAITTKFCEVRILPTKISIYSNPNSLDIDKMQEESIDIGTPVAVLCQTINKRWSYVVTPREEGWIPTSSLAFTNKEVIKKWNNYKKIAVALEPKVDIFLDKNLKQFFGYVRMGTTFPLISKNSNRVVVKIPTSDENGNLVITKGYIRRNDVNIGFLDYTQRNVLVQAFKHLNSPYGWGGSNAEQDCSGILGQIFNCFGIILPENSAQKIKCGQIFNLNRYENIDIKNQKIIENAIPALSFIYLKGHIMLYIGNEDKKPYVLHDIWGVSAYNEDNEATILYINKTIVSDLDLGNNVKDNSLIQRVTKFSILK